MFTTLSYNCHFFFFRAPLSARIAVLSRDICRPPTLVSKRATLTRIGPILFGFVLHSQLEPLFSTAILFGLQSFVSKRATLTRIGAPSSPLSVRIAIFVCVHFWAPKVASEHLQKKQLRSIFVRVSELSLFCASFHVILK